MPRTTIKKDFLSVSKRVALACGITGSVIVGGVVWASRVGEEKFVHPYLCGVIKTEVETLNRPISEKLATLEDNTRILICIMEVTIPREKLEEAKRKAQNPIFELK